MKYIGKILIGIFLIGLTSCEPDVDFSDIAQDISTDVNYLFSDSVSIVVGNDGLATINGKDSCFVELVDGVDVVELNTLYSIGDKYFYGGITSFVKIHSLSEGLAHCRLFNTKYMFDTTIVISVTNSHTQGDTNNHTPEDTNNTTYTFYPEDRCFLINTEDTTFLAIGPKYVGVISTDKFLMSIIKINRSQQTNPSTGGDEHTSCTTSVSLKIKFVGTGYMKFYNEEIDTLIKVEIKPQYTIYEEPPLDFDDNRDSVFTKLGEPDEETEGHDHLLYYLHGPVYDYTLKVNMTGSGLIDDYEITFSDEDAKTELRSFIAERYYKMYSTWNGYYVYVRAFDEENPSIYQSTKAVVENFLAGMVIYKNPSNYSNW